MGLVPGGRGHTYVQSLNDDNSKIGATAADFGGSKPLLQSLPPRPNSLIKYVRVIAGVASIGIDNPAIEVNIRIGIWDVRDNGMVVVHSFDVPITVGNVGEFSDPDGTDAGGGDVYAELLGMEKITPGEGRWGITYESIDSSTEHINTLGDFTITLGGTES